MRKFVTAASAAAFLSIATPAHASDKGWDDAGSIARDALVVAAFGVPAVQGDWDGVLQAGGSVVVAGGLTYGLKEAFPERRPDGSDNKSFPSGHTSVSFAAAAITAGRLSKNTKRAAPGRVNPTNNATVSVAPERDTPGMSALA